MGLDPNALPENILNKLPADYRKARKLQTAAEATAKNATNLERDEQRKFAKELNYKRSERRLEYEWNRTDKPVTGLVGRSDFAIWLEGGTAIFIEFKAGKGKLSPDQIRFRDHIEYLGYRYFVVRSAAQAIDLLNAYLVTERQMAAVKEVAQRRRKVLHELTKS
jgi:hypothetical protein